MIHGGYILAAILNIYIAIFLFAHLIDEDDTSYSDRFLFASILTPFIVFVIIILASLYSIIKEII